MPNAVATEACTIRAMVQGQWEWVARAEDLEFLTDEIRAVQSECNVLWRVLGTSPRASTVATCDVSQIRVTDPSPCARIAVLGRWEWAVLASAYHEAAVALDALTAERDALKALRHSGGSEA